MAIEDYSDLAMPASSQGNDYADLAVPAASSAMPQASPVSPIPSADSGILSLLKKILPDPSLPLGINVGAGLFSSFLPSGYRQVAQALPNIATGQVPNISNAIASNIGATIPSMMAGGESLLGQGIAGSVMGAMQAPYGSKINEGLINALSTVGLGKVLPSLVNVARGAGINPLSTGKSLQAVHDALDQRAQDAFKTVSDSVNQQGITNVPFDKDIIQQIRDNGYLSKTAANNKLLNNAESGNYNALRDLQSDLWTKGTAAKSSDLIADQNKGEEMMELRDRINNAISDHLINTGNENLNNTLNAGRYDYRNLKETFYSNPTIAKLVHENTREIPDNLLNVLNKYSVPMERIRNFNINENELNPWISKDQAYQVSSDLNALRAKQNAVNTLNTLKKIGIGGGTLYGAYRLLAPHSSAPTGGFNQNQ